MTKILNGGVTYGEGICIDCGELTPRPLEPRYPHICQTCLFPPSKPEDPRADFVGTPIPRESIANQLGRFQANALWRARLENFGRGIPEKYVDRPRSGDGS